MKNFVKYIALFVVIASLLVLSVACGTPEPESFQDTVELEVGDTMTVKPDEGFYALYVYETSDENIVSVDNSGCVKALSEGTATVTVKRDEVVIAKYNFTVSENTFVAPEENVAPTSYRLAPSKNDVVVYIGGSVDVEVSVFKNEYASDEKAIYSSLNEEVATVQPIDGGVKIKAVASGRTSVKAKIGGFEAVISVKVYDRNVTPLPAPIINGFTDSTISWTSVADASGYNVSVNCGSTWTEVTETTYSYDGEINPLSVRVTALPALSTGAESDVASIPVNCLQISEGKGIKLFEEYTVAGNENTVGREKELSVYVNLGGTLTKVADKFVTYAVEDETIMTLNDKTVTPVSRGETVLSAKLNGGVLKCEAGVGTPISTKADLDALAFANRDDNNALWQYGTRYILTNDIDYSNGGTALWHERYLAPIAAVRTYTDGAKGRDRLEWGIYGNINQTGDQPKAVDSHGVRNNGMFYGVIDGNGFAIKNAVIPMGIAFQVGEGVTYNYTSGQNFIGRMAYTSTLKNIAFIGLEYETPVQIKNDNPYYYGTDSLIPARVFASDVTIDKYGVYSYWGGMALKLGLIGGMQDAIVENVYLDVKIRNGVWANYALYPNGLLVTQIDEDLIDHPQVSDWLECRSQVRGCLVKTEYDNNASTNSYAAWAGQHDNYLKRSAVFVGYNKTGLDTTINNCYAISSGAGKVYEDTLVTLATEDKKGSNLALYETVDALMSAQGAKAREFFIWNRVNG
ncbi:MAG: Ig-like domain-containing protein [Clostridia bacterium]|nr:Ig-like domain-containing protein [Clostridia bacterium]